MITHNLRFESKIRKQEYPCEPQFYYIKVGYEGVLLHRHVILMVWYMPILQKTGFHKEILEAQEILQALILKAMMNFTRNFNSLIDR